MKNENLKHHRDWDCDGAIRMENAQTIKLYDQIHQETYNISLENYDCFYAFDGKQLDEGLTRIHKTKDQVRNFGGGLIGTKEGVTRYLEFLEKQNERIANECDPQEVYFDEFNNHECMIAYEGDTAAIELVMSIFGNEIAKSLTRYNELYSYEQLILRQAHIKIEGLWFDAEPAIPPYIWFSDVNGKAYCHYNNALLPVYKGDKQFAVADKVMWGMSATYKDGKLYKWHKD